MLRWWERFCSLGHTVHFPEAPALVWGLCLLSMVLGGEGVLGSPLAFLGLILGGVAGGAGGTSCLDSLELPVLGSLDPASLPGWPHILGTFCAHCWKLERVSPWTQTLYSHLL